MLKKQFNAPLLEQELTFKLRGIFIEISRQNGYLYKEIAYQKLVKEQLKINRLIFLEFPKIPIYDNNGKILENYYPDFLVENKVLVEIKAQRQLTRYHVDQLTKYLYSSKYEIGILVNFGTPKAEIIRRIYTNDRKSFLKPDSTPMTH